MADIRLNPQRADQAGITPVFNAGLTTTDRFMLRNDGRTLLYFRKTGAGACTVTVQTGAVVRGIAVADVTVVVPATTGDVVIGPFPGDLFDDPNHDVGVTLSDVVGLTVAVLQLP
jgi:hypothetical protein